MAPNASEMSKYQPFWVRTHFGYFKPWFGVIILLFYHSFWRRGYPGTPGAPPGARRRPPGPPGAPMTPGMSSWVIVSHPGSLWVIFDPSGVDNSSVYTAVAHTPPPQTQYAPRKVTKIKFFWNFLYDPSSYTPYKTIWKQNIRQKKIVLVHEFLVVWWRMLWHLILIVQRERRNSVQPVAPLTGVQVMSTLLQIFTLVAQLTRFKC